MTPSTIKELKSFMIANCYRLDSYSIDGNIIHEGCGIDKSGELYIWFYTERGNRENLKYFRTEEEIIAYAFDIISNDKYANNHLLAMTPDLRYKEELLDILESRGLRYFFDQVPGYSGMEFRIFVVGCDINKAQDLVKYKR